MGSIPFRFAQCAVRAPVAPPCRSAIRRDGNGCASQARGRSGELHGSGLVDGLHERQRTACEDTAAIALKALMDFGLAVVEPQNASRPTEFKDDFVGSSGDEAGRSEEPRV